MKVVTDDHIYKGMLYYVGDSSIRIISGPKYKDLPTRIMVQDIQQIRFKRKSALIKSIFGGLVTGVLSGVWIPAKLNDLGILVSDKVLLYGIIGGAGIGFIVGALSAPILKITIPINKDQHLFEEKRPRLKELSVY